MVDLHLSSPTFWWIDTLPIWAAIMLGIAGGRQNELVRLRWHATQTTQQRDAAIQKRDSEINVLKSEVTNQEQARQTLDATLGRGKREWEATFDTIEDLIVITDVGGKILRCNRATSHALRTGFDSLVGKQIETMFFGGEYIMKFPATAQRMEMRFPQLEGWYDVTTSPTMVGETPATIYVIRNITDRKLAAVDLSRQKEYYETLVRNSPFAIATLNLDSRIVAANPAFESMFGYTEAESLGQDLDEMIAPTDLQPEMRQLTEQVKGGETVHLVTRRQNKEGSPLEVEVFGLPVVLWGKQIGMLALYHDITGLTPSLVAEAAVAEAVVAGIEFAEPEGSLPMPDDLLQELTRNEPLLEEKWEPQPEESPLPVEAVLTDETETSFSAEESVSTAEPGQRKTRRRQIRVEDIEGIGPVYAEKLGELNIITTDDLLAAGATRKGRQELVEKTSLSPKLILRWINIADLMRVPGIGEQYSELLEAAGVDTVKELRNRNPRNLFLAMQAVNQERKLVRRTPFLSEVESWVQAAKELETKLEY
jgi:PAS domain S-box-containing protein